MHTTTLPVSTDVSALSDTPQRPGWRRRGASALTAVMALALGTVLGACGGGGGGGASGADSSANSGGNTTSAWPFPIGMSLASPAALGNASTVVSGALGVDNLGLNTTMTTQQAVLSSQADAVAMGRLGLVASGLVDTSALFDTSARGHASCYGQTVAYANHDNASGTSGLLPAGEVALWRDSDDSSTPVACAAAELNAQTQGVAKQTHQAVLLMAALRRAIAIDGSIAQPVAGGSVDVLSKANTALSAALSGITIQAASVALNSDASEYTWRLVLNQGSGGSAQTMEITMLHTPADTDAHYAGTLRLALSYLGTDASIGCSDQRDGASRYKVARLISLGYNRQDQWLSLRLRTGQYCGNGTSGSNQFGELAATVMSGELDPAVFVNGSVRGATLGWRQGFARMATDIVMSSQTSDFTYAWQDQPLSGTSHARLFAGHGTLDTTTRSRALALFHGYGDDISNTDGRLRGMVCNWNGPGASKTLQSAYQYQLLDLGSNATGWTLAPGNSHIQYAPTNSCSASSSMRFDKDGDGSLGPTEGQGSASALVVPGDGDVQGDLIDQGYLAPVLLL